MVALKSIQLGRFSPHRALCARLSPEFGGLRFVAAVSASKQEADDIRFLLPLVLIEWF